MPFRIVLRVCFCSEKFQHFKAETTHSLDDGNCCSTIYFCSRKEQVRLELAEELPNMLKIETNSFLLTCI